jgi:hypothetical protein
MGLRGGELFPAGLPDSGLVLGSTPDLCVAINTKHVLTGFIGPGINRGPTNEVSTHPAGSHRAESQNRGRVPATIRSSITRF